MPSIFNATDPCFTDRDDGTLIHIFLSSDYDAVQDLGASDGEENQTFVVPNLVDGEPVVKIGTETWDEVDDISTADPTDKVFEYDEVTGTVTFGDDVNGAIPLSGENITAKIQTGESGTIDVICTGKKIFKFEQNVTLNECEALDNGGLTDAVLCGTFGLQTGKFRLATKEALPDDFIFSSGSVSRFDDRLSLFIEETTPSRVGDTFLDVSIDSFIDSRPTRSYISRYDFINVEVLGESDGENNQTFTASGDKIQTPTTGTPIVVITSAGSSEYWSVVDDISTADSEDKVFEYNEDTGTVKFGDDTNGAIPLSGATITLRITIRNGGGIWQFIEIVQGRKTETNIGCSKGATDKLIYTQGDIAIADASKITKVESKLNVIEQEYKFEGTVVMKARLWSFILGGEVNLTGGEIITNNTDVDKAFSLKKFRRSDSTTVRHNGNSTSPSSIYSPASHEALTIDSSIKYPSLKATAPTVGNSLKTAIEDSGQQVIEMTRVDGGVVLSPDEYELVTGAYPIFEVWEFIRYKRVEINSPGTCDVTLVDDPQYAIAWFSWPEIYEGVGIETGNDVRRIQDVDLIDRYRAAVPPIIDNGDRDSALIRIANIFGSFASPIKDINDCEYLHPGNDLDEAVGSSSYGKFIDDNSTQHPEYVILRVENRVQEKEINIEKHILDGIQITPDYTCEWTALENNVTVLSTAEFERDEQQDGGGNCQSITGIKESAGSPEEDWRFKEIREALKGPSSTSPGGTMLTASSTRGTAFSPSQSLRYPFWDCV